MEYPLIDDIPSVSADLDAISHLKGPPPQNESPPCEVHHGISQGNSKTGGEKAQKRGCRLDPFKPQRHDHRTFSKSHSLCMPGPPQVMVSRMRKETTGR